MCSIDVTAFRIYRPSNERIFYSVKHKCHVLKYEFVVDLVSELIIWFNGPWEGSKHDLTITRKLLIYEMEEDEKFIVDKAYIGCKYFLISNRNPQKKEREISKLISKFQFVIKRKNGRIKDFYLFRNDWRGHDFGLHKKFVYILCNVMNMEILNKT